jgi:hypothetical protein
VSKPYLVSLRWRDAHGTATQQYEIHELPHKALEITTYGLLLRDDDDGVSIASEYCGGGTYRGVTFVPRSLVIEVKPVKPQRKKKESPRANPRSSEAVPAGDVREVSGAD